MAKPLPETFGHYQRPFKVWPITSSHVDRMTSLSVTTSIRIYKDMMLDSTVVSCVVGLSVVSGGVQQILCLREPAAI